MKKTRKRSKNKSSGSNLAAISKLAKRTRKKGEKWTVAMKRAAKELKRR